MKEEDGKVKRGVQKINLSEADKVRENAAKERNLGLSLNIMKTTFMQYYTYLYFMKGGEESIFSPNHILLIFSSEPPRNPRPSIILC